MEEKRENENEEERESSSHNEEDESNSENEIDLNLLEREFLSEIEKENEKESELHLACRESKSIEMIHHLLQNGADTTLQNEVRKKASMICLINSSGWENPLTFGIPRRESCNC